MKHLILFTALLLCCSLSRAQFLEKLHTDVSVSFPVAAEKGNSDNNDYWIAQTEKDSLDIRFMAMTLDGKRYNLDAKTITANYDQPEFIDAIVKGMLGNRQGIKVVSRDKIVKGAAKGYEIYMENAAPDADYPYAKIYTRFYFSGTMIYMLGVYTEEEADATELKNRFFNSFTIK